MQNFILSLASLSNISATVYTQVHHQEQVSSQASFFYLSNAVITTHPHCQVYKTHLNCDDYARIIKGSLQSLLLIPNSVKTA
ncbi:hypothetical protein [Nostoc sp.]|uniref:hypothetical protein n=1 Tax=Nostoc sp. TaxID=1180 RepID=UPI002FFA29CD